MKRLLATILALCLVMSLVACAKPAKKDPTEPTATESATQTISTMATATVMPTAAPTEIATADAPEFATDPSEGETDVIASEVTEAPTKETQLIGSTPTRRPITVVKPTTKPTTVPTARPTEKPISQPTAKPTLGCSTKPTAETKPTNKVTAPTVTTEPGPTIGTVAPGSLQGKIIAIYGLGLDNTPVDYNGNLFNNTYEQMMRIAADEWAALNGVTILYRGAYDQNTVLADLSSNVNTCDLFIQTDKLWLIPEIHLASALTEAEYNTLAALVGDNRYLDMLNRKDKTYGLVLPWAGNMMVYFDQSMFAKYDVKSPLEYYNEGSWTWENFAKCMAEITRDLDGDGTTDIYGLPGDSWKNLVNPENRDAATGKLLSTIDDPWIRDFIQLKYNAYRVDHSSRNDENKIESNVDSPKYAMQISACEAYDPQDVFKVIATGDELLAVPLPRWEGENGESKEWVNITQMTAHITSTTKNREAAFDLLCYLTKCGMKYMADCSLGAISCDYTGIQGTTDASNLWKTAFAADVQQRKAALEKLSCYDAAYVPKIVKALSQSDGWYIYAPHSSSHTYLNLLTCIEIYEKPPSESIPIIKEKYLDVLEKFNKAYYS